jgi:hypothetical protein
VKFKYRLDSASWSQAAGTDNYSFTCTSGSTNQYAVTLYKNGFFGDDNKGTKTFTCDAKADTGSWSGLSSGDYHFTMTKADNSVYIVGSGAFSHP